MLLEASQIKDVQSGDHNSLYIYIYTWDWPDLPSHNLGTSYLSLPNAQFLTLSSSPLSFFPHHSRFTVSIFPLFHQNPNYPQNQLNFAEIQQWRENDHVYTDHPAPAILPSSPALNTPIVLLLPSLFRRKLILRSLKKRRRGIIGRWFFGICRRNIIGRRF